MKVIACCTGSMSCRRIRSLLRKPGVLYRDYEPHDGVHRPVTLVFAEERREATIRDALFDRRTVVWFRNQLLGRPRDLAPLLAA